jgi:hypothetical protein
MKCRTYYVVYDCDSVQCKKTSGFRDICPFFCSLYCVKRCEESVNWYHVISTVIRKWFVCYVHVLALTGLSHGSTGTIPGPWHACRKDVTLFSDHILAFLPETSAAIH